jgi:hypothetical protein
MTDTSEPTEEQREAAAIHVFGLACSRPSVIAWVRTGRTDGMDEVPEVPQALDLARLLAEREHRLRADIVRKADVEFSSMQAYIDHQTQLLKSADRKEIALRTDLTAARAQIAELEAQAARLDQLLRDEKLGHTKAEMSLRRSIEREAANLAQIKALRRIMSRWEYFAWSHRRVSDATELIADTKASLASTAHYDVEGGEG